MIVVAVFGMMIFIINAIANFHDWYRTVIYFDKWMHVAGGAFVLLTLAAFSRRIFPKATLIQLTALVFVVGFLWEVYEFAIQALTGVTLATIPDSIEDLVADMVGAIVVAIILFFVQRRKKRYNTPNAN